jgi:hypothetical protein
MLQGEGCSKERDSLRRECSKEKASRRDEILRVARDQNQDKVQKGVE